MNLSPSHLKTQLTKHGIDLDAFVNDDAAFERACKRVYKAIPIPARWLVRKKRVRVALQAVRSVMSKQSPGRD